MPNNKSSERDLRIGCLLRRYQNLGYDNILKFEEITTPISRRSPSDSITSDLLKGSIADKREYYRLRLWHTKVMSGLEELFPADFM